MEFAISLCKKHFDKKATSIEHQLNLSVFNGNGNAAAGGNSHVKPVVQNNPRRLKPVGDLLKKTINVIRSILVARRWPKNLSVADLPSDLVSQLLKGEAVASICAAAAAPGVAVAGAAVAGAAGGSSSAAGGGAPAVLGGGAPAVLGGGAAAVPAGMHAVSGSCGAAGRTGVASGTASGTTGAGTPAQWSPLSPDWEALLGKTD